MNMLHKSTLLVHSR